MVVMMKLFTQDLQLPKISSVSGFPTLLDYKLTGGAGGGGGEGAVKISQNPNLQQAWGFAPLTGPRR